VSVRFAGNWGHGHYSRQWGLRLQAPLHSLQQRTIMCIVAMPVAVRLVDHAHLYACMCAGAGCSTGLRCRVKLKSAGPGSGPGGWQQPCQQGSAGSALSAQRPTPPAHVDTLINQLQTNDSTCHHLLFKCKIVAEFIIPAACSRKCWYPEYGSRHFTATTNAPC